MPTRWYHPRTLLKSPSGRPVAGVARGKEDRRAVPFITTGDVDRIVAAGTDPAFRTFLRVLADTGLRTGEAVRLAWHDVNLARGVLLVRLSKTHKPREVPLSRAASDALDEHRAVRTIPLSGEGAVWPAYQGLARGALSHRFAKTAARAGFPTLGGCHAFRHGFCSRLAQAGVPIPTIAALAGHDDIATTMRYACHLPEGAAAEAIRRLDGQNRPSSGDAKGDASRWPAATA